MVELADVASICFLRALAVVNSTVDSWVLVGAQHRHVVFTQKRVDQRLYISSSHQPTKRFPQNSFGSSHIVRKDSQNQNQQRINNGCENSKLM